MGIIQLIFLPFQPCFLAQMEFQGSNILDERLKIRFLKKQNKVRLYISFTLYPYVHRCIFPKQLPKENSPVPHRWVELRMEDNPLMFLD